MIEKTVVLDEILLAILRERAGDDESRLAFVESLERLVAAGVVVRARSACDKPAPPSATGTWASEAAAEHVGRRGEA